jgi:predicted aspartyl protease
VPSLTVQLADLQAEGPRLEVRLTDGAGSASPAVADALVDTGATVTVVANQRLKQLRLSPIGTALVHTPSSSNVVCYKYLVRLVLPNDVSVETVAIGTPLRGQHIQCLIGRDVLRNAVFVYTGNTNTFTLSF